MPSGRFGAFVLVPATNTVVGVCAAGKAGSFNLNLLNNTGASANFKVAIVDGDLGDLAAADYIEDSSTETIPGGGGVYKLTGEPIGGAVKESIVVWSDQALVVRSSGFIGDPLSGES